MTRGDQSAELERALANARAAGDQVIEGNVLWRLGDVLVRQDRYLDARAYFEQAQAVARATGNRAAEAGMVPVRPPPGYSA